MHPRETCIAFLCGAPNPPSRSRFEDAARDAGASMLWLDPHDLATSSDLAEMPAVAINRSGGFTDDAALGTLEALAERGVPCLPSPDAVAVARDKSAAWRRLHEAGVPVPRAEDAPAAPIDVVAAEEIAARLGGFPLVVKSPRSMRGAGVALARDAAELSRLARDLGSSSGSAHVQERLGDGSGQDVRVMLVGDTVLGAVRRTPAPGEFRANHHQGASISEEPLTPALSDLALAAARALDLPVAGVDLIEHHGSWHVIEANSSPGFDAFEATTGIDVAAAVVRHALDVARNVRR